MKLRRVIWTVVKYAALTVCGILLYLLAAKCTLADRGYFAIGGEGLFLLLPVFYGVGHAVVRDWIREIKGRDEGVKRH